MNNRISQIRKMHNLNQQEFANKIGLTKNFISLLETGNREPSDRTISDICRIFNIQEDWLRYGLEPMKLEMSREEEIAELVGRTLSGGSDFQKAVVRMICSRTDEQLKALEDALQTIYDNIQKEGDQN